MEKVRIQDNLYMAVNGEWLETAVIPDDRPTTGGFSVLDQEVEALMMKEFKDFSLGKLKTDIKEMEYAISLYKKVLDTEKRNELGIKPALPLLDKIKGLKDINDLNKMAYELMLANVELPISLGVDVDMQDATKHSFIILGPSIILPDTQYYNDEATYNQLISIYSQMAKNALAKTNLTKEEQDLYLADTLAFDKLVAKAVKSRVEWADYVNNYNPTPLKEVVESLKPFDFEGLLKTIYGANTPDTIIVYDPRAIKEFNTYFNLENFDMFKHYAYVKCLLQASQVLSLDLATNAGLFRRALVGINKEPELEKQAYQMASKYYSEPIGLYYGRKYFGEEAKADVVSLVKKIIETYKERMAKNTFLEEATKEKAIKKLSTIVIKMGYPDKVDEFYTKLAITEEESYFDAVSKLTKEMINHNLEELNEVVDRTKWVMPGHMVNACYNPSSNDITFPAAILQKPFYSIKQSVSENLGGIGAVIAHEISHAFDNNGAHFDENGNIFNWWSEKDFESFKALTKDMILQWDGIPFHGSQVNGELVVSENIADNGGMAVTLAIMHTLDNPDFKAYFKNWARIWCLKAKEEYIQLLLKSDVHSPAELRANIQVRNFDEWYEAFDVKDTDLMYIPKEKRIIIW